MSFEQRHSFTSAERIPTGLEIIWQSLRNRKAVESDVESDLAEPSEEPTDADSIHKEIYSEYLEAETKKHNAKWLRRIRAALFKNSDHTAVAESLAYEQALKDNLEFDAQLKAESAE